MPPLPSRSALVRDLGEGVAVLSDVGGKAASLNALLHAGLPVPDGFVLTTAAYRDWRAAGSRGVPTRVAHALLDGYRRLGGPVVAVRSSATSEDLPGRSAAGQHETVLGVHGEAAVLDAVVRCWRSLHSDRAVAYRRHLGLDEEAAAIAVVVQRQIDADAAGVAFSYDPVSGSRAEVVVNAVAGLGERLVAGEAIAEVVHVHRRTGRVRPTGSAVLDGDLARRLAGLVEDVEEVLGADVDVEWCRAGDLLWLVQARPVTAGRPLEVGRDPWNDSRAGDFLWTSTNVGEAIPDVMTPATWSMVQVYLRDAMATASVPPQLGWGRIGGRVYLNVSVMAALSRAVGVREQWYRLLTEEVFGRLPAEQEIPPVPASRRQLLTGLLSMAWHVLGEQRYTARHPGRYLAGHPERCEARRREVASAVDGPALARLWTRALEPELHRISWLLSAATRSSGAAFVTARLWLRRLVGPEAAADLTAGVGRSPGRLASLGPLEGLQQLERGEIDPETFDRRYGHRGPHEFELSRPRPAEQPDWLPEQLAQRGTAPAATPERQIQQERRRQLAWQQLRRRHPVQARVLGRWLAGWDRTARTREEVRSEVVRYFWVLREYVLRAGELTGLGEDIFFLDAEEIRRALHGERLAAGTLAGRRRAYQAYCRLPPYPGLVRGLFDPYSSEPGAQVSGARVLLDVVRGLPGSAGVAEGRVRVLTDADAGAQLRPGEVLVTTVTNVGWTPLFPRAAAVVTDVGAPLSHAAIVARELGLPAVVGCGNATAVLRTGDRVRVDGSAGTVELLGDPVVTSVSSSPGK